MEEDSGSPTVAAAKEASKRTSGIAGMLTFLQPRPSMDTDSEPRSSDRPRKAGMGGGGGKVKPGQGSKHKHSSSGDLHAGEPPSPLASSQADSPCAAWASANYPPADVTDTLSLSQPWPGTSPAPVCTGTPTRSSNSGFFKFPFKKRHSSKGGACPGVPSSPTLAGATPTHGSGMTLSASGSSLSGAAGSQSPSESLCRAGAGAGAGQHGGSKLGQYSSCSGDPDEAEFGSCYSDAPHSPNLSYQEAMYGGDTLDLRQAGYNMPGEASPMVAVRQDLPEVFTPGFSQLLDQGCSAGQQTPGTPPDSTAMLEPTVALLSSAQLAQAGQVHDVHAMLLSDSTAQPPQEPARSSNTTSSSTGTGTAAARARVSMSQGDSSRRQTLPEVEETSAAAHSKATPAAEQLQAEESPVAAEDVQVDVDMADAPVSCIASGSSSSPMPAEVPEASNLTAADADEQQSNSTTAVAAGGSRDVSAAAEVPAASTPLEDSTAQQATALTVVPATADTMLGSPAQASAGPASPAPQADATAADAGDEAEVATAAQGPVGLPADCKSSSEADACSANTATEAAQADEAPAPAEQAPVPDAAACPAEEDRAASPQQPHAENSSSSRSPDCSAEAVLPATAEQPAAACSPARDAAPGAAALTSCEPLDMAADSAVPAAVQPEQQQPGSPQIITDAPAAAAVAMSGSAATSPEPHKQLCSTEASTPAPAEAAAAAATADAATPLDEDTQKQVFEQQPGDVKAAHDESPAQAAQELEPLVQQSPTALKGECSVGSVHMPEASSTATSHAVAAEGSDPSLECVSAVTASAGQEEKPPQQASDGKRSSSPQQLQEVAQHQSCSTGEQSQQPSAADSVAALGDQAAASPDDVLLPRPEPAAEPVMQAEGSEDAMLLPGPVCEPCEEPMLQPEASEEPVLLQRDDGELDAPEPTSPTAIHTVAAAVAAQSPVISARQSGPGSSRRTGRTPVSLVRESIPLFVSDPSRAVGAALVVEEDSLDDQDMQQLSGDALLAAGQAAGLGAAAATAAGAASRLLTHGGPQRVAVGFSGSHLNPLTPVAEGFMASPIPEETSTGGSSQSRASSRYEAAAAGSPGSSPVRHLALSGHSPTAGGSPRLGMTPGSVYSTPTLTMGQAGNAGRTQLRSTPPSAVSSAVGSAIREVGGSPSSRFTPVDRNVSPAMPGLPDVSPTLALMSNMGPGAQGESGHGSTPSLLDARAASPSAVYSLYSATPFRGALEALPIAEALNAPLVDNSPFNLTDDISFDTAGFAQEAQRVAQNLAAAAAAGGNAVTPLPARTPAAPSHHQAQSSSGGVLLPARMMSPTDGVRDLAVEMMTKQIADLQSRVKLLEDENLTLRNQVEIYEFEKTELNSQEEMEKQARQYAEEQLQSAQMELQVMRQAKNAQQGQLVALKQEFEGLRQEAARRHLEDKEHHLVLEQKVAQMQEERNQALDRINLLDMELTALRSNANGLQQRVAELETAVATRDRDLQDMARIQQEAQSKLEKAVEQMIAAQTAKEHARQKVDAEAAKAQQLMNERQQLMAERDKHTANWQTLKTKYMQKSSTLKEVEQRLQAKEAEVQELMAMCDQLLAQQEAQR